VVMHPSGTLEHGDTLKKSTINLCGQKL